MSESIEFPNYVNNGDIQLYGWEISCTCTLSENVHGKQIQPTYSKVVEGESVSMCESDEKTKEMFKLSNNCLSSLYQGTPDNCRKFVCLLLFDVPHGEFDLKFWLDIFRAFDFDAIDKTKINNMHPVV
jgi:hypothetical protein